jgi:formate-dependent nitrite reductase membrane component NrfD
MLLLLEDAQHFVRGPEWTWYILFYFFFGGLSGGSYALATLLRLTGRDNEPAARVGYYVSFATLLPCPVLLTLDLGQPLRFWHMLVNTTPGNEGLVFKYWSPMSVGAWALVVFGAFSTVSFVEALARDRGLRLPGVGLLDGAFGQLFAIVGAVFGLFIAGYTGVLLAVSNQPVWSDTWSLGALFLASSLSASAALMGWVAHQRRDARDAAAGLVRSERFFQVLELLAIGLFVFTLIPAGNGILQRAFGFPWYLLWAVALLGIAAGLRAPGAARPHDMPGEGAVAVRTTRTVATWAMVLVLLGMLAMRAAVIFSAQ